MSILGVLLCLLAALWWLSSRAARVSSGGGELGRAASSRQEPLAAKEESAPSAGRAEIDSPEARLVVEPGQTASVSLPVRPLQVARGTLRRADGSPARGVRLRPLVPGWPAALAEVWTATVARDGRFELVLGASSAARALPLDGERELAPFPLAPGDGQDFVLP